MTTKELSYLVSNIDLEKKFKSYPNQAKVLLYPDLNNMTDILDVLPNPLYACFILLKTSENSGHWTCLCRNQNHIYYFDSYGVAPDGELTRISANLRYELNESQKSLTRLLHTIPHGFTFSYNSTQFQEYSPTINTCGKWSEVFAKCIFKGLTIDDFLDRMESLKEQYKTSYDKLVCSLWKSL